MTDEETHAEPDPGEEDLTERDGPLPDMAYSATRLETVKCLYRFYAKYLAKLPEASSPVLGFGTFCHRAIERYIKLCVTAKVDGDGVFASQAVEEVWAEMPGITPEQYGEVFALMHWFAQNHLVEYDKIVGTELEWAVDDQWQPCGWHDPQVRWRGRIDQLEVDGSVATVVDWKSNRAADSQRTMEAAYAPKIYAAMALAHNPSLTRVHVVHVYVRHNIRRAMRFELSDLERAKDELDQHAARIDKLLVNKYQEAAWPAMPGASCTICGFLAVCPRKAEVTALGAVTTPALAVTAAENILYLETAIERQREMLREWVKAVGPVHVGREVFDYWRTALWEYDVPGILALCKRLGIAIETVMRPDKKALDKLTKLDRGFGDAVAKLMTDVGKDVFKHRKPDETE